MYCRKCNYTSHDHLTACPKCGRSWEEERKELGLGWMIETTGVWLEPEADSDRILEPELPEENPVFQEESEPASTDAFQDEETPEALKGMDMRIVASTDGQEPAPEAGEIDFPELKGSAPHRRPAPEEPAPESAPSEEEIIGVDFFLDEDLFEEIPGPEQPAGQEDAPPPDTPSPDQPRADIEFADLLDLEDLLVPPDEKK